MSRSAQRRTGSRAARRECSAPSMCRSYAASQPECSGRAVRHGPTAKSNINFSNYLPQSYIFLVNNGHRAVKVHVNKLQYCRAGMYTGERFKCGVVLIGVSYSHLDLIRVKSWKPFVAPSVWSNLQAPVLKLPPPPHRN